MVEAKSTSTKSTVERRKKEEEEQYSGAIANIRRKLDQRKAAREKAREQEENFLDYKKMQILYEFKPKSSALEHSREDVFPKKRFDFKEMAFGARRAYFLALRPNPAYGDWHGKKEEEKRQKAEKELDTKVKKSHLPVKKREVKAVAAKKEEEKKDAAPVVALDLKQIGKLDSLATCFGTETPRPHEKGKGTNTFQPLNITLESKYPFWFNPEGEEEMTDEDSPIDSEALEKAIKGDTPLKHSKFKRGKFNPYEKLDVLRSMDQVFFAKDIINGNTLYSVLLLDIQANEDKNKKAKSEKKKIPEPKEITWDDVITEYIGPGANVRYELKPEEKPSDPVPEKKIDKLVWHERKKAEAE